MGSPCILDYLLLFSLFTSYRAVRPEDAERDIADAENLLEEIHTATARKWKEIEMHAASVLHRSAAARKMNARKGCFKRSCF
mmetsp:Transcript_18732/g.28049  ORF Transcript_18732/g.28049 Transcript_18732/m.28049 type:complete len:82 (+) Transcript_18732:3855-4100(+)